MLRMLQARTDVSLETSSSRASVRSTGEVVVITRTAQFNSVLSTAGEKLCVVDFTAKWCGPCRRFAPVFVDLAKRYRQNAIFLKVDVDINKEISESKGVRIMPTFHFYRNSILIEEFSGADQQKLTDTLNRLVPVDESKSESECPYKHFPLRLEELTSFDKVKFDIIREKLVEFSSQVPDEIRLDSKCVCDGDGITVLDEIISALSDRTRYHSSKLETRHFSLISTLLSWPTNFLPPILNLIRIAAFHPCFSSFIVSQNSSSSKGTDFLSRVLSIAKTSENDICTLVLVRTICNMFSRLTLSHLLVTRIDDVLDAFNSCCSSSKKLALRLAYACLLINYSIAFMHQHASAEDIVLPAKIQILSCASELLSQSPQNVSKLVYRVLVIVGTLVFRDSMTKSMAVTLEFPETVKTLAKVNASDERIVQVCEELQQALAATTQ